MTFAAQDSAANENWQQLHFGEVNTLFANPVQGWVLTHFKPVDHCLFPFSTVNIRFNWGDVEPEEGKYNWKYIDDIIAACKPNDATVVLSVMPANTLTKECYCSPKWLFDCGCKGVEYTLGKVEANQHKNTPDIPRIEPVYDDPIFLAKHGAFIAALGKRYDGDLNVEFVDIGSYQMWGEWAVHKEWNERPVSAAVRKQIVDMYLNAFHKTQLIFLSDGGKGDGAEVMNYALAHGAGFRRNGIGSPWDARIWFDSPHSQYAGVTGLADAWKRAPVVFEWYGSLDYQKSMGWSFDAAVKFMLRNHVTMIDDNVGKVPPEDLPQLENLIRLAGYRFVLREAGCEKSVNRGAALHVKMEWANAGVGKLYRPFKLQMSLHNAAGQVCAITDTAANPCEWLPGEHEVAATISIPDNLPPGEYTLATAIIDPTGHKRPLNLAMDAPARQGWYLLGQVKLE